MGAFAPMSIPDGVVKSGARVLDVFDFLYNFDMPAREVDIRTALSLPKSSANDLLKTMVMRGYLAFDVFDRTYSPSYRLARFGSSLDPVDSEGHGLSNMLKRLKSEVGETILLAEPQEIHMQVVALETNDSETRKNFSEGRLLDVVSTASGRAYLMTRTDEEVLWIARRNARLRPMERTAEALDNVLCTVRQFAKMSYASASLPLEYGPSLTIAMPLPKRPNRAPLILAVGGTAQDMGSRVDSITASMRDAISDHFGFNGTC